jgi:hypothetical protein
VDWSNPQLLLITWFHIEEIPFCSGQANCNRFAKNATINANDLRNFVDINPRTSVQMAGQLILGTQPIEQGHAPSQWNSIDLCSIAHQKRMP